MAMLAGEAALVTGAGNGIGRAMCHELAAEGAKLFLVDLDASRLAASLSALSDAGAEADGAVIDLSVAGSGVMAVEHAVSRFGIDPNACTCCIAAPVRARPLGCCQ
jgi:NAD(P)-dependent dehydrogenase (short-subunit alcohol dehydrogenase family)